MRSKIISTICGIMSLVALGSAYAWLRTSPVDVKAMEVALALSQTNQPATSSEKKQLSVESIEASKQLVLPDIAARTNQSNSKQAIPFKAETIASSHSALAGVMAGFALAALFLLIERVKEADDPEKKLLFSNAMFLLFVAFLTGSLAAYSFSTITGEEKDKAYCLFQFPSAIFAFHVFSLLAGINIAMKGLELDKRLEKVAWLMSRLFIVFSVLVVGVNLVDANSVFGHSSLTCWLGASVIVAIWLWKNRISESFGKKLTLENYCYFSLGTSIFLAILQGAYYLPEKCLSLPAWILLLIFIAVTSSAAWTLQQLKPKILVQDTVPEV